MKKTIRLDRWASQLQPPRNPRLYLLAQRSPYSTTDTKPLPRPKLTQKPPRSTAQWTPRVLPVEEQRQASTATAAQPEDDAQLEVARGDGAAHAIPPNFPSPRKAARSAKLSALHARLSLPAKLPVQTLARCLIDPSVDPRPGYNNSPLAILGQELMGYHTTEHLLCHYPRLPLSILFAAVYAYMGPATLAALRNEWGIEIVAAPGREVDPGLLQLKRTVAGNALAEDGTTRIKDMPQAGRLRGERKKKAALSSRIVYDDIFGDPLANIPEKAPFIGAILAESPEDGENQKVARSDLSLATLLSHQASRQVSMDTHPATVEGASAGFVRALAGALYLHAGSQATKDFVKAHILSRHLPLHTLFNFTHPTRDLATLCKREQFEPPVARLISETGRLSRHPVFIVGVFSGNDKLGEGAGSSLNEGRIRAAAAALRSWYLYSPPDTEIVLPSDVEGADKKPWKPQMVDLGEIIT